MPTKLVKFSITLTAYWVAAFLFAGFSWSMITSAYSIKRSMGIDCTSLTRYEMSLDNGTRYKIVDKWLYFGLTEYDESLSPEEQQKAREARYEYRQKYKYAVSQSPYRWIYDPHPMVSVSICVLFFIVVVILSSSLKQDIGAAIVSNRPHATYLRVLLTTPVLGNLLRIYLIHDSKGLSLTRQETVFLYVHAVLNLVAGLIGLAALLSVFDGSSIWLPSVYLLLLWLVAVSVKMVFTALMASLFPRLLSRYQR